VALELRTVPPAEAFNFYSHSAYTGFTAYSLDDLCELLNYVPADSVEHHMKNLDFSRWARDILGDTALAEAMAACADRLELIKITEAKRRELWQSLK
jgi:alpha-amylase